MQNNQQVYRRLLYNIGIVMIIHILCATSAMSAIGYVQNLSCTSGHTTDEPSQITIIEMAWTNPLNYTDGQLSGYITVFNNQEDYSITTGSTIDRKWDISDPYENKNSVSYYFHIAAVASGTPNPGLYPNAPFLEIGETKTAGPYIIDTIAPTNLSVSLPPTTTTQAVDINISATGAYVMCISNIDYGNCNWEDYTSQKTDWLLTGGDGIKQVYVQFRDKALNISNAPIATCTYEEPVQPYQGTVICAAIPTLNEWGMIILAGLILLGFFKYNRNTRIGVASPCRFSLFSEQHQGKL
jgi:hypothetical protein